MQQDHDQKMWPMHVMDAELEVQRTIASAEFKAFMCLFRRIIGPTTAHMLTTKGSSMGFWRREMKCIGPKAKAADV